MDTLINRTETQIEVSATMITNAGEFYSTPEFLATGDAPLTKGFDFICGYVVNGRAFEKYRVKMDGLILFREITGGCSVIHDGPFYLVETKQNGFVIDTELAFPSTFKGRSVLVDLQKRNGFAVTKDFI